jgi:hypothetical protein
MTPRRSVVLLALAAVLAGLAGGLWLLGGDGGRWAVPGAEAASIDPPPPVPPPVVAAAAGREVTVEVTPVARLAPLAPLPDVAVTGIALAADGVHWIAGAAAVPGRRPVRAGLQLLRLHPAAGGELFRAVRLRGAQSIEVRVEPEAGFAGRIVDEDGAAVAGASVWLGGVATVSGADGAFRFAGIAGGSGVPLVVRATGFATLLRIVDVDRAPPEPEPRFVLAPGASLEVQLAAPLPVSAPPRVLVLPDGAADSELLGHPFFLQTAPAEHLGRAPLPLPRLDAGGAARLEGLPRGAGVTVTVVHPQLVARSVAVRLRDAVQRAVVTAELRPLLRGRAVDASGAPIAGALALCTAPAGAPEPDPAWLLPPAAYLAGAALQAATDAGGAFAIGRWPSSPALLELRAAGRFGVQLAVEGEPAERAILLPAAVAAEGAPALRLHAAQAMRLRVRQGSRTLAPLFDWSGNPHLVRWPEPQLVDVRVVVAEPGRAPRVRSFPGVVVAGSVDLAIEPDG